MDMQPFGAASGDESGWLDRESVSALRAVIPSTMPSASAALYARWWQLETWLRELVYVELRSLYGQRWSSAVSPVDARLKQDAAFSHMSGPDNDNPLAYLDYSQLLALIDAQWEQLGYALLERRAWDGRQEELKRIRHRIGHMRKPHADDLNRLEQTLRDLERGTYIALASYNERGVDDETRTDPVTLSWIRGLHPTAQRLTMHARRQYETHLIVNASRRPWASIPSDLAGAPGILWHADFILRGRTIDAAALWHDSAMEKARPLIVHMLADYPGRVGFTFSAVDEPSAVADAIGEIFDAVLMVARPGGLDFEDQAAWQRRVRAVDYRVLSGSGWSIVDESTLPFTSFSAGGGVKSKPDW